MSELQKDLVLSPNEYAYVLDETKGNVACNVGPHKAELDAATRAKNYDLQVAAQMIIDAETKRKYEVEKDIQAIKDAIAEAERARKQQENDLELAHQQKMLELETAREAAAANSMKTILEALGPDLAAALKSANNQAIVEKIASSISPYAIAKGEPVSDAVSKLIRGTTLEEVLNGVLKDND